MQIIQVDYLSREQIMVDMEIEDRALAEELNEKPHVRALIELIIYFAMHSQDSDWRTFIKNHDQELFSKGLEKGFIREFMDIMYPDDDEDDPAILRWAKTAFERSIEVRSPKPIPMPKETDPELAEIRQSIGLRLPPFRAQI